MASGSSPVQSIDRVFDIIETLSTASYGMALTELAAAVELHVSTTHRLLSALAARGYVHKDIETGKYRLTMRFLEVGTRAMDGVNLLSLARPYLENLARLSGETVHLAARYGDEVVYLYKEDTYNSVVRMASFVGQHIPMYCTGLGKAILSHLPVEEVRAIWERSDIVAFTPQTIVRLEDMLERLSLFRTQGYATDLEEHEEGITCVSAPILDFRSSPIAAISISFPTTRVSPERMAELAQQVRSSAESLSTLLGSSSGNF